MLRHSFFLLLNLAYTEINFAKRYLARTIKNSDSYSMVILLIKSIQLTQLENGNYLRRSEAYFLI
jgi:hypothetical protein